ncbi:argininosuccinate lyase [Thermodesulfatator indicus DSM 15286]|uniref:Argininosuccinate lyase n=1 Tax=Thermodesulfatator indicus (strain DSM 15286 / JCM 11887 / CIR29812) TaxID=667014 RepID=F8A939_THEID|nr:argininosuccinate lyase [Thermodesulfatator indicus]AEH45167.1 argininosuccinate lyase [Thermodesulfatator indicus DSM 15286]
MAQKPWGGRFSEETDKLVEEFTASVHYDKRLALYDIRGSIAHARMLGKTGIIPLEDAEKIIAGLKEIEKDIKEGRFKWRKDLEDVHMNIEAALYEKIGPVAGKLHTARSRNDQVATDVRLFLRDVIDETLSRLKDLRKALVEKAKENLEVILPGFTHLQHAQPVLLAHHLMAYYEMFTRDAKRFAFVRQETNVCPLGSAALAGTPFPVDREMVAQELGFAGITRNSMDAVSDRDFIVSFLAAASLAFVHLSRLSEELILWISQEFGFIDLPDKLCTGSSIMPQKKNPDVAELIRGKSGRVFGNLFTLLTVLKGLPMTYNRDLQEDKEPLFDTVDTLLAVLALAKELIVGLKVNRERMRKACEEGHLTATDLADYLVTKGLPFREAHHVVGRLVAYCEEKGQKLWELPIEKLKEFSELIGEDVYEWLTLEGSVSRRKVVGGTAPEQVEKAIYQAEKELEA